jgi:virginiamycin B lyase
MRRVTLAVVLAALVATNADALAQSVVIEEWPVPYGGRPRDPDLDAQGRVWFVGQAGNYIARLDPATGEFRRYEIEPGTHPHNLIVDAQGMVWYAGNRNARIGRLDPETGKAEIFPMPDSAARDPHTLTFDSKGDIWFTVQGGNFIGRLARGSGTIDLVKVPTARARPYGIRIDSRDRPWVVLFGTHKLATIDPATLQLTEHTLPRPGARPRRLEITADDAIWYVDYQEGYLGRFDPASGAVKEWRTPGGADSRPYATALDGAGRIWFFESGVTPNRLVGFDPRSEQFFAQAELSGERNTVRHAVFHAPTGTIWFGTDTENIGRARVLP